MHPNRRFCLAAALGVLLAGPVLAARSACSPTTAATRAMFGPSFMVRFGIAP